MTEGRGRGHTKQDHAANLSEEQVERRLGGGADLRVMHVRPKRVDARRRLVIDTTTILAAALVSVLAWQVVGGGGSGPADTPGAANETGIAIGSSGADAPTLAAIATLGPVANASIGLGATPTPIPFATLGPGTLRVVVAVTNDNGGNDVASDWTITVTGGGSSPSTFSGSSSGTVVAIDPSTTFTISTVAKTLGGYVESRSGTCSGSIPKGFAGRCTITEDDKPVAMTVKVVIKGGTATPASVTVSVVATGVDKPTFKGSATGTLVHFNANAKWTVTTKPLTSYVRTNTSSCSSTKGAVEGAVVSCTLTFTYSPTPTPTPAPTPTPTPAPVAAFTCTTGTALAVSFTNQSTGPQSSWLWDFGDLTGTSTAQNPADYTYASAGNYTVTLTVTGAGGSNKVSHVCTAAL